ATQGQAAALRLFDLQWRFDESGSHAFARSIVRISSANALSTAGNIAIQWHSATEAVTVHRVVIHRGSERIDVLAGGQRFTVLRRESGLEQSMVDGQLTAALQVPDLRVGDSLEMAMTITEANPMLGGHSQAYMPLLAPFATDRLHILASWPAARRVQWRAGQTLPQPRETRQGGVTTIAIDRPAFAAAPFPDGAPARFLDNFALQASDFGSWSDISAMFAQPFAAAARLRPDSPLRAEAARIAAASQDPVGRAEAALALVQSQVRYVFDGSGLGGYMPVAADQVWASRFGDCKGKTVLLVALLRELGIEAVPALVSVRRSDGIDQALPMPGRFDHALARVRIAGWTYWLDGTRIGDSDLARLAVPPLRWALPLTSPGSRLERLDLVEPDEPTTELTLEYDQRNGLTLPAQLRAEVLMRGDSAAELRRLLEALPPAERQALVRAYWTESFADFEVSQAEYSLDERTGALRYTAVGTARVDWNLWGEDSGRRLELVRAQLGYDLAPERRAGPLADAPVALAAEHYLTRYRILLPMGGADFTLDGEPLDRSIGPVRYRRTARITGGRVEVEAVTRVTPGEIAYAEAQAADQANDEVHARRLFVRAPLAYEFTEAERALAANNPRTEGQAARMEVIRSVMTRLHALDFAAAVTELTEAMERTGRSADLLVLRATAHFSARNDELGEADLDAALALEPNHLRALLLRGRRLEDTGRHEDALIVFDRVILAHPQDPLAYVARARLRTRAGRHEAALADLDIVTRLQPENREAWIQKVRIHSGRQDHQKALDAADALLRLLPEDATAHALRGNVLAILGRREEARTALERSLQLQENADAYATRAAFDLSGATQARLADMLAAIRLDPMRRFPSDALRAVLEVPGALEQFERAYQAGRSQLPPIQQEEQRRALALLYAAAGSPQALLALLDEQIARNPRSAELLNERCWERAIRGLELDRALADCNAALAISRLPGFHDSRGLVHLRRGDFAAAIADYDAALALQPRLTYSLYGRGLAKIRRGDRRAGEADLAAAREIRPTIAEEFRRYGVEP
ncbi:MAG: DUF3857 domain-containing protein, partial [Pseudomonadota bacterium]|nr:DUF3857 domain-containing protein [Pseudomonadota bacterium]